jgi:hypothetical protein
VGSWGWDEGDRRAGVNTHTVAVPKPKVVDLALLMATMTPASSVPHQVPGDSSSDDSYSVAMIQLRAQMIELNQQVCGGVGEEVRRGGGRRQHSRSSRAQNEGSAAAERVSKSW